MALEATIRDALRKIAEAFRAYAKEQGWQPGDYRILAEVNQDWGRIHVVLVAPRFPGAYPEEHWLSVINFLDLFLSGENSEIFKSMNLTLRTFDQVQQGGLYALSPDYVDIDELLATQTIR